LKIRRIWKNHNGKISPVWIDRNFKSKGHMSKKLNLFLISGASIVGICLIACVGTALLVKNPSGMYQKYLENSSLKVGDIAPDFELPSLDGESIRLSQFKGRPVLLTFSASWCPECRREAPVLQDLHESRSALVVLLVDINESPEIVKNFSDEFGFTFPVLLDEDGSVSSLYQIFAIPTGLFIDPDGVIRARVIESITPELLDEKLSLIGIQP
jgi:peroxiredoxin